MVFVLFARQVIDIDPDSDTFGRKLFEFDYQKAHPEVRRVHGSPLLVELAATYNPWLWLSLLGCVRNNK